ncbi:MAG: ATP-binding cassette domain-containing protein, partial [Deltaproteobacteria bacterium]|nr:ATP-binding cassette domain-containing protein [Deltaproteobacteria bacterium]
MSDVALEITGLDVTLPQGGVLFQGLDLEVHQGEVVVILGGSGAGKSTLARVLFQRDELLSEGFSITYGTLETPGGLGLVPQRGALFDHLDVAGNLALAHRHRSTDGGHGSSDEREQDAIARWLKAVDLPVELAQRGTPVSQLSGGQAQRVAVARTLASQRRLVFCDEPSVGLDPERVSSLAQLLRETARGGSALVVVTHDLDLAAAAADRLLFLDPAAGKLVPLCQSSWPGPDEAQAKER